MGFEYGELEGIGYDNLGQVIAEKKDIRAAYRDAGVKISNFAVLLPDIISMDPALSAKAMDHFRRGAEAAAYFESANLWIDSFFPPVEVLEGRAADKRPRLRAELQDPHSRRLLLGGVLGHVRRRRGTLLGDRPGARPSPPGGAPGRGDRDELRCDASALGRREGREPRFHPRRRAPARAEGNDARLPSRSWGDT